MKIDHILEIGIDDKERLYIKPATMRFTLIYTTATGVHWDDKGLFLYSPKPGKWEYFDWYKHIMNVVKDECNCELVLTEQIVWSNITDELRERISNWP